MTTSLAPQGPGLLRQPAADARRAGENARARMARGPVVVVAAFTRLPKRHDRAALAICGARPGHRAWVK